MMPMCSGQGCRATVGSFSQRPASCCVRPIKPWSISLNMPSPPTHTTLLWTNTGVSVRTAPPNRLSSHNGHESHCLHCTTRSSHPSKPVRSFFRRWSRAWFARSVTEQTIHLITYRLQISCINFNLFNQTLHNQQHKSNTRTMQTKTTQTDDIKMCFEMRFKDLKQWWGQDGKQRELLAESGSSSWTWMSLTYHMRADTSQLKQRRSQRVVDLSSFPFSSKRVDKHQQPMWTQRTCETHSGILSQQTLNENNSV